MRLICISTQSPEEITKSIELLILYKKNNIDVSRPELNKCWNLRIKKTLQQRLKEQIATYYYSVVGTPRVLPSTLA
jgi:hypothetical protein